MMWFDGIRQPNTLYVASVSRGKDSTAMLRAIQLMNWPLDAIVSVDIWFDDDTPAELPPLVKFKDEWDAKCLDLVGVPVTRVCATKRERERESRKTAIAFGEKPTQDISTSNEQTVNSSAQTSVSPCSEDRGAKNSSMNKLTCTDIFYRHVSPEKERERELLRGRNSSGNFAIYGYPMMRGAWCTGELKNAAVRRTMFSNLRQNEAQKINIVHYIGIAADEPKRIERHIIKPDKVLPLVQIGWDEDLCGLEATYMDMLSPTYINSFRDGCWFCHNQGIGQLRDLRRNYPELWAKLLVLDDDSPVTFRADGHTVHDFERRFQAEDDGLIYPDERFRWADLEQPQLRWF